MTYLGEIQQQPDSLKAVSEFKKTIASFELLRNKIRKKIRNINEEVATTNNSLVIGNSL